MCTYAPIREEKREGQGHLGYFLACFYGYKVAGKMFLKFCLEFPNESLLVVRLRLQAAQKASAVHYTVCTEANEVCCMP